MICWIEPISVGGRWVGQQRGQEQHDHRADDGAEQRSGAADDDHRDDLHRDFEHEALDVDEGE